MSIKMPKICLYEQIYARCLFGSDYSCVKLLNIYTFKLFWNCVIEIYACKNVYLILIDKFKSDVIIVDVLIDRNKCLFTCVCMLKYVDIYQDVYMYIYVLIYLDICAMESVLLIYLSFINK